MSLIFLPRSYGLNFTHISIRNLLDHQFLLGENTNWTPNTKLPHSGISEIVREYSTYKIPESQPQQEYFVGMKYLFVPEADTNCTQHQKFQEGGIITVIKGCTCDVTPWEMRHVSILENAIRDSCQITIISKKY